MLVCYDFFMKFKNSQWDSPQKLISVESKQNSKKN
jgi:hypothetical protein